MVLIVAAVGLEEVKPGHAPATGPDRTWKKTKKAVLRHCSIRCTTSQTAGPELLQSQKRSGEGEREEDHLLEEAGGLMHV